MSRVSDLANTQIVRQPPGRQSHLCVTLVLLNIPESMLMVCGILLLRHRCSQNYWRSWSLQLVSIKMDIPGTVDAFIKIRQSWDSLMSIMEIAILTHRLISMQSNIYIYIIYTNIVESLLFGMKLKPCWPTHCGSTLAWLTFPARIAPIMITPLTTDLDALAPCNSTMDSMDPSISMHSDLNTNRWIV